MDFCKAVSLVKKTRDDIHSGWAVFGDTGPRDAALLTALREVARHMGVLLAPIHSIPANGEIHIEARDPVAPKALLGKFGPAFANWLNQGSPRVGNIQGARLNAYGATCQMHHLTLEKLIVAYHDQHFCPG